MTKNKPTWNEKLVSSKPHVVKHLDKNFAGMKAGQMMLLPSAKLIDEFVQTIPSGKSVTMIEMRRALAKTHSADVTCPIASGFCIKIVAEAAFEKLNEGTPFEEVTPVWRVLDKDSPTLQKVSFDKKIILDLKFSEMSETR